MFNAPSGTVMFRLSLLGKVELQDADGRPVESILAQPKRLALLAYLMAAVPRGFHERDALLALLWPDQDAAASRNTLRQAVHQLRKALGAHIVAARGTHALGVGQELSSDVVDFEAARQDGDFAAALRCYAGDFMPGFVIDAAPFNEWVDATRARLRHEAARTAWALAEKHERAGNDAQSAASARRAAELLTDDEVALRQVLALLDRVGDGSGAIAAYEAFAERLQREFDVVPSVATRQLVEVIRGRTLASPSAPPGAPPRPASSRSRPRVGVRSFANLTGDPTMDYVGRLAASTIATHLVATRLADVEMAGDDAPAAEPAGSDLVIEGSYHLADGRWQLMVTLRGAAGRSQLGAIAPASAPRERVWEATEAMARRTVGAIGAHLDPRVASWANVIGEPPSYEAHQAHVLGVELHLRGDYQSAIAHLLAAASTEAGFAVPLLWAIQASCNLGEFEQAAAIQAELASHRARLAPAERFVCDYYGAWLSADRGTALRLLQQAVDLVPDTELLVQLGRDALQQNRVKYAAEVLERVDPDAGWVPSWTPYWQRLTEAYHLLGEHRREMAAARRARQQHPEAMGPRLYEARAAAAMGDVERVTQAVDDALALGADRFSTAGHVLLAAAQELRVHGDTATASAMLDRAIEWQCDGAEAAGGPDVMLLARLYYERGQWAQALALVEAGTADPVDRAGWAGVIAARTGDTDRARASIAALKAVTGPYLFGRQQIWAARVAAVLGDREAARTFLRGALARGHPYGIELHTDLDLGIQGLTAKG